MKTQCAIVVLCSVMILTPPASLAQSDTNKNDKQEEAAWIKALQSASVESLSKFLEEFPQGIHANDIREHKAATEEDTPLRKQDETVLRSIVKEGKKPEFTLSSEQMGKEYNLWLQLASSRVGRVQFAPKGDRKSAQAAIVDIGTITIPKELAGSAANFMYADVHGVIISGPNTVRTISGHGIVAPTTDLGFQDAPKAEMVPMGKGSVHVFLGRAQLFGMVFEGSTSNPLRFAVWEGGKYVYLGGNGQVQDSNGKVLFSKE